MIHLIGNIYATADEFQYIVGRVRERPGKGLEIVKPKYYSTLEIAARHTVEYALREKVAKGEVETLRQFITEMGKLRDEINQKIKLLAVPKESEV